MTKSAVSILFASIVSCMAMPAAAQQALGSTIAPEEPDDSGGVSGFVAVGGAVQPQYEGSDEYQLGPFALANLEWRGMELQLRGLRARVDLFADSPLQFGPAISRRQRRNDRDTPFPLSRLPDVKAAFEVGGYVGYRFGGDARGRGETAFDLTVLQDVSDAHDGLVATAQVSYAVVRSGRFFADVDAQVSYGTGKFMRTYFGITPAQAAASGIAAYDIGSGLRDVAAGTTLGYQFNERWGLLGRIGASRYIADAQDSPVVALSSKIQVTSGVGVTFRF